MAQRMTTETLQAIEAGMPACPLCGGRNVRSSHAVRLQDKLRAIFHYAPYRCRGCQHRFYQHVKPVPKPIQTEQGKAGQAKVG